MIECETSVMMRGEEVKFPPVSTVMGLAFVEQERLVLDRQVSALEAIQHKRDKNT